MEKVDFGYVDDFFGAGHTVYQACFQLHKSEHSSSWIRCSNTVYSHKKNSSKTQEDASEQTRMVRTRRGCYIIEKDDAKQEDATQKDATQKDAAAEIPEELIEKTEAAFDFLVTQGINNGYDVDKILGIPLANGGTCFQIASAFSEKISNYIIGRGINVNTMDAQMLIPHFKYPSLAIQMMEQGINPYVIVQGGANSVSIYKSSFESEEAKRLLASFPRSVHYSIEDIKCPETCPKDCSSNFTKYFCKNGPFVEMIDQNRIGSGGFGMLFRGLFHGKEMALKCTLMKMEESDTVQEIVSDLEKDIAEIRIQMASDGSGIIVPVAFVRQQNQEKDDNGKWIAKNYNIFIYPLYDCDLDKLHENYNDQFTEEIIFDIIHQCFIRTGSI